MTSSSSPNGIAYDGKMKAGVVLIALSGICTISSLIYLLAKRPSAKTFRGTHIFGYFACLLVANALQAIGSMVDFYWAARGGVVQGVGCEVQGAFKQAGDIAAAIWFFTISVHLFTLVFLRRRSNKATFISIVSSVWTLIFIWTLVSRFALQKSELGPYFGVTITGCEISAGYQGEVIFFEYLLVLLSLVLGAVLYLAVFLRIRSKKSRADQSWKSRFTWDACTSGDASTVHGIPTSTVRIARLMMWFPVYYTSILLPVTIVCICAGYPTLVDVPFAISSISSTMGGLLGVANVFFFLHLLRCFPKSATLPLFRVSASVLTVTTVVYPAQAAGQDEDDAEKPDKEVALPYGVHKVELQVEPDAVEGNGNVFIPPDSWKTTGGRPRRP